MDQRDHNSTEDMPQFLKALKNRNSGYRVPNDYFAQMQANVLDKVLEKKTVQHTDLLDNVKNWYQLLFKFQYGYVGLATIALIVAFVATRDYSTGITNSFASLDDSDLEYFMENEIDDIDDQDIMATLSANEIDFNDFSVPISSVDLLGDIPDHYIDDLDNTVLIDFELED